MPKSVKIWLWIATLLVLLGGIVFAGVMTMLKWDFSKLTTCKYQTNEYVLSEAYQSISVLTDTASVVLVPSEDGNSRVVCHEQENVRHTVVVNDGRLEIAVVDTRKWYEYIGISLAKPQITLYLPQGIYASLAVQVSTGAVRIPAGYTFSDVAITTSTGAIDLAEMRADSITLSVSTGHITASEITCAGNLHIGVSTGRTTLSDVTCKRLISQGSTGDLSLCRVVAQEEFSIQRGTGDVRFDRCDAATITVKTSTGNVTGTLMSEKVFIVQTDTGRRDVPTTTQGGRCEITTDTGDIRISLSASENMGG